MKYIKNTLLGSVLLWGLTLVGGDGTLPFGDGTLPFGMEGIAIDLVDPRSPELPVEVSFAKPEFVEETPMDSPVLEPLSASITFDNEVVCPLGMTLFESKGSITFGSASYKVIGICAVDDLEGRKRLIIGSNGRSAIALEGTLSTDSQGEESFVGVVKTDLEVESDASYQFELL